MKTKQLSVAVLLLSGLCFFTSEVRGNCVNPDDFNGTVLFPAGACAYTNPDGHMQIVSGLPVGTTIEIQASLESIANQTNVPGGALGGEIARFDAVLVMKMTGTGILNGFNRTLFLPVNNSEAHLGPRILGSAVQDFPTDMFRLDGQLFGDPDFCTFRIEAGTASGLPSPGHTTLTRLGLPGSDFQVDSFFDIAYRIEFQGCPGSALEGFGGITPGTVRLTTCPDDTVKKLKFQQLPLDGQGTLPDESFRYYGHDEVSTAYSWYNFENNSFVGYQGCFMADDFADLADSPVVCLKWWGSYLNNIQNQSVRQFLITFEEDIPAGADPQIPFSHPGKVLSSQIVNWNPNATGFDSLSEGQYLERLVSPGGQPCNEGLYEYCAVLDKPFPQKPDTVYWLKIVALVRIPATEAFDIYSCIDSLTGGAGNPNQLDPQRLCEYLQNSPFNQCNVTRWGWHNRDYRIMDSYASTPPAVDPGEKRVGIVTDLQGIDWDVWHFQDDAVSGEVFMDPFTPLNPNEPKCPTVLQQPSSFKDEYYVYQLARCDIAAGTGVDGPEGIEQFSKDLAFELWTQDPPPPPEPDKVLKFQQLPLDGQGTIPGVSYRYYGHDEVSTAYSWYDFGAANPEYLGYAGCFMADDFADEKDSPVICLRWWGSYINNEQLPNQPVRRFLIAFEEDIPAVPDAEIPFSHPGRLLSSEIVTLNPTAITFNGLQAGEFCEVRVSDGGPPCNEGLYEYCTVLRKPFPQKRDTVYWLKIVALVDIPASVAFDQYECIGGVTGVFPLDPATFCNYLKQPFQSSQCPRLTRWGWHNRDYRIEDPYASGAIVPGENIVGTVTDPIGQTTWNVWHFQDDAVSGQVLVDNDPIPGTNDPTCPNVVQPPEMFKDEYYLFTSPRCNGDGVDGPSGIEQFSKDLAFELWTLDQGQPDPPRYELGDAPDSTNSFAALMTAFPPGGPPGVLARYPTVFAAGSPPFGPLHFDPLSGAYLGAGVSQENEADIGPDADGVNNLEPPVDIPDQDDLDDGIHFPLNLRHCDLTNTFDYDVTIVAATRRYFVNAWSDWNQNGDWNDTLTCLDGSVVPEWIVQNQIVDGIALGAGVHTITTPPFAAWISPVANNRPETWLRINISEQPWTPGLGAGGAGPAGGYQFGETEDYFAFIGPACWDCPGQALGDATGDGNINLADLFALKSCFGLCVGDAGYASCICADFNRDGCINLGDLFILKANFGTVGLGICP